jgi:hypothetical protein
MLALVIGLLIEAPTATGIAHQMGLRSLGGGHLAPRSQRSPLCF